MRHHSPGKGSVLSIASMNSLSSHSSIFQRARSTNHNNSRGTEQFGNLRTEKIKEPQVRFRVKRKELPGLSEIVEPSKPLASLKKEIAEIKDQIKKQRSFTEATSENKLDRFISLLRESVSQKQTQPIFYPVPMPLPYLMQNQNCLPAIQSRHNSKYPKFPSTRQSQYQTLARNPGREREVIAMRIKKNMGKWRRVGNAVLFWAYLKRFCLNVQKSRLILFDKFAKNYRKGFKSVLQSVKERMNPFFKILIIKNQIAFAVQEGERQEIRREKVALMRGIIKIILQGLSAAFSDNQPEMTKFVYFLCRHGSYSCTHPLLTFEQLQLSCISGIFRYISADSNLSKAAIINLLYIKTLLFSIFLSPFQLPPQCKTQIIRENLLLVSSVLYELVIEVQDEYLTKVAKSYQIGNFESFDFVKMSDGMVVGSAQWRAGELISGLLDSASIKRSFNLSEWGQQKKVIKIFLHTVSESLKATHMKLVSRHY